MKLVELGYVELETLKALVKGETTLSHYVTKVNSNGDKFNTLFLAFVNGKIQNVSGLIAKVTNNKLKDRELVVEGCGTDPFYAIMDEFNNMLPTYVEHFKLDVTLPTRYKFSSDGIY